MAGVGADRPRCHGGEPDCSGCPDPSASVQAHLIGAMIADDKTATEGQARELAFTPMGGAYNQMPADATAFVHREDLFLLEWTGTSDPGEPAATRAAAAQWLSQVRDVLAGHGRVARIRISRIPSWRPR